MQLLEIVLELVRVPLGLIVPRWKMSLLTMWWKYFWKRINIFSHLPFSFPSSTLKFRIKTMEILSFFPPTLFFHLINKKESILHSLFSPKFQKTFPHTLLFGTPVLFETLEYVPLPYLLNSIFKKSKLPDWFPKFANILGQDLNKCKKSEKLQSLKFKKWESVFSKPASKMNANSKIILTHCYARVPSNNSMQFL